MDGARERPWRGTLGDVVSADAHEPRILISDKFGAELNAQIQHRARRLVKHPAKRTHQLDDS